MSALIVAGVAVAVTADAAPPQRPPVPTFTRDIAPIFHERCTTCHRPGQVSPMSLLTFKDARPWSRAIRARVASRTMPPGVPDAGHPAVNGDRRLTDNELMTILAWVDGGAPEGDPADMPPPPAYLDHPWQIGVPEVVFPLPRDVLVPAAASLDIQRFEVPTPWRDDRWIQALELRPTDRTRVHFVMLYERPPAGTSGGRLPGDGEAGERLLGFYASGADPLVLPAGTARRLTAGSTLVFEVHYVGNGTAGYDRTAVAMRFAPGPPEYEAHTLAVTNTALVLPPGDAGHPVDATWTFGQPARLISVAPHAHRRGKAFTYTLERPDGTREPVLQVSRYNWLWQSSYRFATGLEVPAGTVLRVTALFDNSAANKANPDPKREVRWGWDVATADMMFSYVVIATPRRD